MKVVKIILALFFISCQSIVQNSDMVFKINKSMVDSFDFYEYKIQLNELSQKKCQSINFSRYNYVSIQNFSEKIPLIESTMSFRPPCIFIYVEKGKLCTDKGLIKLQVDHLKSNDSGLIEIKQVFK